MHRRELISLAGALSAGLSVVLAASPAMAHELDTDQVELCEEGPSAYFTITDPLGCAARIAASVVDGSVASVTPSAPVTAVTETFEVMPGAAGDTDVLVSFQGSGNGCTEIGDKTVHVVVRPKGDPACDVQLKVQIDEQGRNTLNQRYAAVAIEAVPIACACSKVIITQTIQIGTDPPKVDVDQAETGSDAPFYNYDPMRGDQISKEGFGGPGTCGGDQNATLLDAPLQTTQPVAWEACAICCDDGSVLGCQSWRFDPTKPGGKDPDSPSGMWSGRYYVGRTSVDFSPAARDAYRAHLEAYWNSHPDARGDRCSATYRASLNGQPPPAPAPPGSASGGSPPPPNAGTPSSGGGCDAAGRGAGDGLLALGAFVALAASRGALRRRRRARTA